MHALVIIAAFVAVAATIIAVELYLILRKLATLAAAHEQDVDDIIEAIEGGGWDVRSPTDAAS